MRVRQELWGLSLSGLSIQSLAAALNGEIVPAVREKDLFEVLSEKRIAGAALDVFAEEPPDPDNPLFRLDNVTVTPHSAALTVQCMDRMALDAARGIHEVLSGALPTWPVNRIKRAGRGDRALP